MLKIFLFLSLTIGVSGYANNVLVGPPVVVSVTGTSAQVLPANGNRGYLLIINTGSNTAYVKFGSVQATTEGVPIPAGGNYEPIQAPANSIFADTASSTTSLTIIEGNF